MNNILKILSIILMMSGSLSCLSAKNPWDPVHITCSVVYIGGCTSNYDLDYLTGGTVVSPYSAQITQYIVDIEAGETVKFPGIDLKVTAPAEGHDFKVLNVSKDLSHFSINNTTEDIFKKAIVPEIYRAHELSSNLYMASRGYEGYDLDGLDYYMAKYPEVFNMDDYNYWVSHYKK